jgi:hypothetical protein
MTRQSKNSKLQIRNSTAEFLTFACQSKGDGVEVRMKDELNEISTAEDFSAVEQKNKKQ